MNLRNAVSLVVLCLLLASAGAITYASYEQSRPCAAPIAYAVGDVDPRFGVSTTTVGKEAEAAAEIWNTVAGKPILRYDSAAKLKIDLVYDAREADAKLGEEITRRGDSLDSLHATLDGLRAQVAAKQDAYNAEVSAVNASGGATPSQGEKLDEERAALADLSASLDAKVAAYNDTVKSFNTDVEQYDQDAGRTFKEGEFVEESAGEHIAVYEFIGTTQLERVLAHELGHAIGLGHNDDPDSIMYAKNESGNLAPTAADRAALAALCGS